MSDASSSHASSSSSGPEGAVRTESWSCGGVAELDLAIQVGRMELTLGEDASTVELEVRAELPRGGNLQQGLAGLLDWIGQVTGQDVTRMGRSFSGGLGGGGLAELGELLGGWDPGRLGANLATDALQATEVRWSADSRRLVVRSPENLPERLVPLVVTVRAPAGSRLALRTGAGDITVTGRAGAADARTGSGDLRLDAVDGDAELGAGSGKVSTGAISGRTRAKTGSGDLSLGSLGGPGDLKTGSGNVRLGGIRADLLARTGSGNLVIEDAEAGRLDLTTGSGDLRIGVHAGVTAELDLSSGSGRVRSDLDVREGTPSGVPALVVHGRAGSGNVLVSRAG